MLVHPLPLVADMKFSYYVGCRERILSRDYDRLIGFLHEHGYTAIEPLESELAPCHMFASPAEAAELRTRLDREGIAVCCYSVCTDVYTTPAASRAFLLLQAEIAAALGSPYLHHTIYPPFAPTPDMPSYNDALEAVLPTLCEVIRYAASLGVTVIYEPQGLVFNGSGLTDLIARLRACRGCEGVGVCFDFGNPAFVDCHPQDMLDDLMPLIRHVHVKDYKLLDSSSSDAPYNTASLRPMTEVAVGEGDMHAAQMLARINDYGYGGYYSIETTPSAPMTDFDAAGIEAVKFIKESIKG